MDRAAADAVTKALLTNIHRKLQEAANIAKAAEACAVSGNVQSAVRMVMDIEETTYQANRMLNAALLISSGQLNDATN
jgi:coenzyme F420-reducing hydrogenase gamma subunit